MCIENKKITQEDIEYLCRLLVQVLKIPVNFLDDKCHVCFSFSYGSAKNPIYTIQSKNLFKELFESITSLNTPIIKSTHYHENYLLLRLVEGDLFKGTFIVGPSTYSYITVERIDDMILEYKLPLNMKRHLIYYYKGLTVLNYIQLINAGFLLHYCIYNKRLKMNEVMEKSEILKEKPIDLKKSLELSLSKNRQNVFFHHSLARERALLNCIKGGDEENLLKYHQIPLDGEAGILSRNNPLRAQKNLAICSVTLATRAAIEGGLSSEEAYTLSDVYIQEIEETGEIKTLFDLELKMLCDFTKRVHQVKMRKYSKAVRLCCIYIFKHLYETISLVELAKYVTLHPNYLSELFKKETGFTVSEYIQREKIEEAKRLLTSSEYSLLDIAAWLGFHDQSHFTRVFKKFEGITPSKYRAQRYLL